MAKNIKPKLFDRPRPPRHVMVCGHKVKVRIVKNLIDDNHDQLHGAYNGDTKTIFLAKDSEWKSVLFHELIHACWHLSGASEGVGMSKEEQLVLSLEYGIAGLFI